MLRFYFIIVTNIFLIIYFILLATHYVKHPEKYSEFQCYKLAQKIINLVKKKGRIHTDVYGLDKLPKEGGYIMYANHQGKYDALGIISAHDNPCSVVIDSVTAAKPLANQVIDLMKGARFVKGDLKQQATEIIRIIKEVKAGKKYLVFPEAGYADNKNELIEFHAGSFKMALKAKCPIVPVALIDSYKPFGENSLKKVKTQVHFIDPIEYDEYKDMNTQEISALVKEKIRTRMEAYVSCAVEQLKVNIEKEQQEQQAPLTKNRFLGVYNCTTLLSYLSLALGIFGAFMAMNANVPSAITCLILATFTEVLDKKLMHSDNNRTSEEKHYGTHVDSFGDLICFGVLPCLIGWAVGLDSILHVLFYVFYTCSVVVRLSYLSAKKEDVNAESEKYCQGLPVKTILIVIVGLYLFKDVLGVFYGLIMTCVYPIAGISFVSSFKIRKPKVLDEAEKIASKNENIEARQGGKQ